MQTHFERVKRRVVSVRLGSTVTRQLSYDLLSKAKGLRYSVPSQVAWTVTDAIRALLVS